MTVKKPSANPLPISFDQFRKNPVAGVAFLALVGVSYLYMDLRSGNQQQIDECRKEMAVLLFVIIFGIWKQYRISRHSTSES
jgi:hypothetical protein